MQYKIHSILIISSLVISTLGLDIWRIVSFCDAQTDKIELSSLVDISDLQEESDEKTPIEGEQNPFAQYSDLIEKEPQCYDEQFSLLKLQLNSSVLVFFLHFTWQNIFMDSMYTPPEV